MARDARPVLIAGGGIGGLAMPLRAEDALEHLGRAG
jgi:hypothetical protein